MVTEVTDGDTLFVRLGDEDLEVRLNGINSPERDECFYEEASAMARRLLDGAEVVVEESDRDQFGRTLAYLWLDGEMVNREQVAAGGAIATTPGDDDPHGESLVAAETEAIRAASGMWAADVCGATGPVPEVTVDMSGSRFDPAGPDEENLAGEWVTFAFRDPTDIGGWTVRDESSAHRCRLDPGSSAGPGAALRVDSSNPCWAPGGSPIWNNDGDSVLLMDEHGRVVAHARFDG